MACVPLDGHNIRKLLEENAKIIPYADLCLYSHIDKLLHKTYDYVVVLLDDHHFHNESPCAFPCTGHKKTTTKGHWIAILKYHNEYELFDSISENSMKYMKQPLFIQLFDGKTCHVTTVPFQKTMKIYRHVVIMLFIEFIIIKQRMNLDDYIVLMSDLKMQKVGGYDFIVSDFVLERYKNSKHQLNSQCIKNLLC
jgi:hypothetical protein